MLHQSLHLATFLLSQYDTPVPPLRDVNEVSHITLTVGLLIVAVAIATNSHEQVFLMRNRASNHFESLATVIYHNSVL